MYGVGRKTGFVVLGVLLCARAAGALTIHDVQRSDAGGSWQSAYAGQIVDVTGGVVTFVGTPPGKKTPRAVIQDPTLAEWGGVEIKVFAGTLAEKVRVGDRVDLTNVFVDESSKARGTTYLLYDDQDAAAEGNGSGFTILGGGQALTPTVVSPSALGAGDAGAVPSAAEKYEGMLLEVRDVTVGSLYLGSHNDNYELIGPGGTCWASDYMNLDRLPGELYHPDTATGLHYASFVGILEQYTKSSEGYDYYQLLSLAPADEATVPEPATAVLLLAAGAGIIFRHRSTRR